MRVRLEHLLRGIVIVALAVMLWQSLRQQNDSGGQFVNARGVGGGALAMWSTMAKAPGRIQLQLDSTPSPIERAWLGALAGAGSSVMWSGDLAPLMIDAQPVASPTGGTKVLVAAPGGSSVVVSDDVGPIDTVRAQTTGAMLALGSVPDLLTARVKGASATTTPRDSIVLRKVLVIGDAGWESKFTVAALEEEGWKVDAFIRLAPGVDVTQGSAAPIDTSRYTAVIALDGAASPFANRIVEFVRTGGGVVLTSEAASLDAMAPLRAGAVGRATSATPAIQTGGSVNLATLALAPITSLRNDAVPIEKRAGVTAIAARRMNGGRVLQIGYEDTWRWRMAGGDQAVRDHRVWWTHLVSSVAYSPRISATTAATLTDEAPMIGLVDALGRSASEAAMASRAATRSTWIVLLFLLMAIALVGEIASRRLRGTA
jgi:hypothetical protein